MKEDDKSSSTIVATNITDASSSNDSSHSVGSISNKINKNNSAKLNHGSNSNNDKQMIGGIV